MNSSTIPEKLIEGLNADTRAERLGNLKTLAALVKTGAIPAAVKGKDVNNHIHTTYSFSPYSPAKALWMAYNAGLATAGIMDHDSISGAEEFIEAGKIIGMATTIGVECRVKMGSTPLGGKRINNPDQDSVAYVAIHGVPHQMIGRVADFFKPYSAARGFRNRRMTGRINEIMRTAGISIDYDKNVLPLSLAAEGGSVTERHLLYALSLKIVEKAGKGAPVLKLLKDGPGIEPGGKVGTYLADASNPMYEYDLLGALKGSMVEKFYIDADDECPDVKDYLSFAKEIGAISAYAYLGDVGDSVTGDKKAQRFEDSYIDELFEVITKLGFNAVTYMPSRNTQEQLSRVRSYCERYNLFQISGEDINSPRQSFVCEAQRKPEFANLYDSTWALIGHEASATRELSDGIFSNKIKAAIPDMNERIKIYKKIGLDGAAGQ